MHDTGCLGLVHWDDPEGWYGEGGGRRVQDGEHIPVVPREKSDTGAAPSKKRQPGRPEQVHQTPRHLCSAQELGLSEEGEEE